MLNSSLKKNSIFAMITSILLIFLSVANSIGSITKIFCFFILFIVIICIPIVKKELILYNKKIFISGTVLSIYNIVISFLFYENSKSLYNGLLYSVCILFFVILINININNSYINLIKKYMNILSTIIILISFILTLINKASFWVSMTSFTFLFLYFIYLADSSIIKKLVFTLMWIYIALKFEERTFVLIFPILVLILVLWNVICKNRHIFNVIIVLTVFLLIVIPIIYVILSKSEYRSLLDQLAIKYTNSRFFSGRDIIWGNMFEYYINKNIIFGAGQHITPNYIYGVNLSAHNTYVSIICRTGIVGVLLFFNLLIKIWKEFYKRRDKIAIKLSAAFFIVILLKHSSELGLVGNNISLAIMTWIIIGFGFIHINSTNKN